MGTAPNRIVCTKNCFQSQHEPSLNPNQPREQPLKRSGKPSLMNIIAMGTGEFALPMFLAITKSRHCVDTLITQPPRLAPGRHKHAHSAIGIIKAKQIKIWQILI